MKTMSEKAGVTFSIAKDNPAIAHCTISKEVIGGPDVQSRGVIYLKDADHILAQTANILVETIKEAVKDRRYENMAIRVEAKEKISRFILKETGKKPMILPAIVEINVGD